MKRKILFLCTANACRSQMAEGLVGHLLPDAYEAYSAGTRPGELDRRAVAVMKEIGIDISRQRSKSVRKLEKMVFDLVVTLCDDAREACPVPPGKGQTVHIGFKDPVRAASLKGDDLSAFRVVRDDIRDRLIPFLVEYDWG